MTSSISKGTTYISQTYLNPMTECSDYLTSLYNPSFNYAFGIAINNTEYS